MFFKMLLPFSGTASSLVPSLRSWRIVSVRDLSFCGGAVIQKKGVETRVFLFLFQFSITQLVTASPPNFTRLIPSLEMTLETRHFQEAK